MPLSREEEETVRQRVLRALANSNPGAIQDFVSKCKSKLTEDRARNALDLLTHQSSMVHTLANDIVILLEDRRQLLELLEIYEHLEEELDDVE